MKVIELAKSLKLSENQMMKFLSDVNILARNGSTKLDMQTVKLVKELYTETAKETKAASLLPQQVTADFDTIVIRDLADTLGVKLAPLMQQVMNKQWALTLNSSINWAQAVELAEALSITLVRQKAIRLNSTKKDTVSDATHPVRPPVITVMGHVDHGKTSLLDTIRKSNVQAGEAGAITQHIGAYQVKHKSGLFTFLDTPGHAAFTALRARGVQLTDIVVLVIAGDDGIKPQTVEAIEHAKSADVPIIVAINKVDRPESDPEAIKQRLTEYELVCEEWGGDTIVVPLSAKTGKNIDTLLDMIQLTADILELTAPTTGLAQGVIIEAGLSRQTGPVATVLIQSGCLETGQFFATDTTHGKVRALINQAGERLKSVTPGTPVEIMGFTQVPQVGTLMQAYKKESDAKKAVGHQKIHSSVTVSGKSDDRSDNTITLVLKGDTTGSIDALKHLLADETRVKVRIVRTGLGDITEDDVNLAGISEGLIIGFGVKLPAPVKKIAEKQGVKVRLYTIIYRAIDDISALIQGNRIIDYDYKPVGEAVVRKVFHYSKFGAIAGSYITSGTLTKNARVSVMRKKKEIASGHLDSLKRFKDDVTTVSEGFECGIVVKGVSFEPDDVLICYEQVEVSL